MRLVSVHDAEPWIQANDARDEGRLRLEHPSKLWQWGLVWTLVGVGVVILVTASRRR